MKTIDVKEQPKLSLARTFEVCINGIKYRLFRSAITMVVIAVATAFMMNVFCEGISVRSVSQEARQRTEEIRRAEWWTVRLAAVDTPEAVLAEIAGAKPDAPLVTEAMGMGAIAEGERAALTAGARAAATYLTFFNTLDHGKRRILVGGSSSSAIFDRLRDANNFATFDTELARMKSTRFPTPIAEFRAFLDQWPVLRGQVEAIRQGRATAIARINDAVGTRTLKAALTDADGAFGQTIADAGFVTFDGETRTVVAAQARQLADIRVIEEYLDTEYTKKLSSGATETSSPRKEIAARLDKMSMDVKPSVLWKLLRGKANAAWFLEVLRAARVDTRGLTPDGVVQLANAKAGEASLERALQRSGNVGGGFLGMGDRMTWLVLISMLVCVVGISNAMLMTVTERFREIATLKCLGALDTFIMTLFILEAGLFGLVGGLIGCLIGSLIGFGRMFITFGGLLGSAFPAGEWGITFLFSVTVGIMLAALAGVYPSYVAARLAPMEAMRIE